ncbi:hypothetical protein T484DRAFT_1835959 [Baffinella frigidus]|nr:hypothetical protein T484DRAFT_1835959 [Cryptophyta sp. CCMP2293]
MRCATHPRPGDSNLSDPRCNEEGCTLRAAFGVIGRRPSSCRRHAQAGQMDLVHKLCEFISPTFEGCTRQASFGEVGAKARYCKRHRAPHHLQIRWKGGKAKQTIALHDSSHVHK